jgi:hypothetical protein
MNFKIFVNSDHKKEQEDLLFITGQSFLAIDTIKFNKSEKEIEFEIERYPVLINKKRLFSFLNIKKYDKSKKIKSLIKITNVEEVKLINTTKDLMKITLQLGIVIQKSEIILCSVEELQGIPLFMLVIVATKGLLELKDITF